MDTMNDLLICAERLGHKTRIQNDEVYIYYSGENFDGWIYYNPIANNAQAFELLKHLIRTIPDHRTLWLTLINLTRNGELSNEAIIKAVVAMEESK